MFSRYLFLCLFIASPFFSTINPVSAQYLTTVFGESAILSHDVAVDSEGSAYITGSFIGTADFQSLSGSIPLASIGLKDIFVAKYDVAGTVMWSFGIGGIAGGPGLNDEGHGIQVTESGQVCVTGYFQGTADFDPGSNSVFELTSAGLRDAFIACYTSDGVFQWAKSFGGPGDDFGLELIATDDQVSITGLFRETATVSPGGTNNVELVSAGQQDGFVIRFDANGEPEWGLGYGDSSVDSGKDVGVDAAGNVYVLGEFSGDADFDPGPEERILSSANRSLDVVLASYTSEGAYRWAIPFGSGQADGATGLAVDMLGRSYVTGHFVGIVDFDPGSEDASLTSTGARDAYVAKYLENGEFDWVFQMGSGFAEGADIDVNQAGHVGFVGMFSGDVFPSPSSTQKITSQGEQDVLIASYTTEGSLRWAGNIGGPLTEFGSGITTGPANNVFVSGHFENAVDFDPGDEVVERSSRGELDAFLVQYNTEGALSVGVEPYDEIHPLDYELDVYPNPANSSITVILPHDPGVPWQIEVLDSLGRTVILVNDVGFHGIQMHINISTLAAGTYYVRADNGDALLLESFVIAR